MYVPARSAAAINSSPGLADTVRPSRLMEICPSSCCGSVESVKGTPPLFDMHEEFVAEHGDARGDRRRDRQPQHADGRLLRWPGHTRRDVVTQIHEKVEIFLASGAVLNSVQDAL